MFQFRTSYVVEVTAVGSLNLASKSNGYKSKRDIFISKYQNDKVFSPFSTNFP